MAETLLQTVKNGFADLKAAIASKPMVDHSAAINSLQAQIDQVAGENEQATTKRTATEANLSTAIARAEKAEKDLAQAQTDLKSSNEKQADFDAKVEAAAATKAQEIVAKIGHVPVKVAGSDNPAGEKGATELKGLARYQESIKSEVAKLNPKRQ